MYGWSAVRQADDKGRSAVDLMQQAVVLFAN